MRLAWDAGFLCVEGGYVFSIERSLFCFLYVNFFVVCFSVLSSLLPASLSKCRLNVFDALKALWNKRFKPPTA